MVKQTEADNRIRFRLLSNGLDFIMEAVNRLTGATHRDYKYAILHLCSGIELILKERLRREHLLLIAEKPQELTQSAYESGDFRSVSLRDCLDRLKNCGVHLEDKDRKILLDFRKRRNRIEHLDMEDTVEAIKSSTATVLNIIFGFIHKELDSAKLGQNDQHTLEKIHQGLFELRDFVKARMKEIKPELQKAQELDVVFTCPWCFQNAAVLDDGLKCLFCRYEAPSQDAAEAYILRVLRQRKDRKGIYRDAWPQHTCPECGVEAMVEKGEGGFLCFQCGASWKGGSLQRCERCNEFYEPVTEDMIICGDCFDDWMSRD